MAENNVVDILKGVVSELKEMARSESIIGDPITVGDKTVIPIVKINVGFGAGGGQGEDDKKRAGFGGGGGGGASIEPAAFIIIRQAFNWRNWPAFLLIFPPDCVIVRSSNMALGVVITQ